MTREDFIKVQDKINDFETFNGIDVCPVAFMPQTNTIEESKRSAVKFYNKSNLIKYLCEKYSVKSNQIVITSEPLDEVNSLKLINGWENATEVFIESEEDTKNRSYIGVYSSETYTLTTIDKFQEEQVKTYVYDNTYTYREGKVMWNHDGIEEEITFTYNPKEVLGDDLSNSLTISTPGTPNIITSTVLENKYVRKPELDSYARKAELDVRINDLMIEILDLKSRVSDLEMQSQMDIK